MLLSLRVKCGIASFLAMTGFIDLQQIVLQVATDTRSIEFYRYLGTKMLECTRVQRHELKFPGIIQNGLN
jgi:hypothetical protein